MKTIRIGNDIQINWTITRFGEPEDFTGKNVSVSLIDKFGEKQIFDYEINGNVISGTYFGKHQKSNGVYRLLLNENLGENDMVSLDYIDCFCLSNKLKNQTSNGSDSTSSINTEIEEFNSDINTTTDLTMYARKEYVDDSVAAVKLELESEMPTKVSDLTNDLGFLTQHQDISGKANSADLARVAFSGDYDDLNNKPNQFSGDYNDLTNKPNLFSGDYEDLENKPNLFSGNYNDLTNKPNLFSGNYNDLSNKPSIPSKTSDLSNDSNYVSDAAYIHTDNNFTTALKNKLTDLPSSFTQVQSNWNQNDSSAVDYIKNKPSIPTVPTNVSEFTNDAGYLTEHQSIKTINNQSLIGTGNIEISASGVQVQSDWNQDDTTAVDYIKNKPNLFSGDYDDLTNKPSIPSKTSDLNNDSNFVSDASYVHTDNNFTTALKNKINGVEAGAEVNAIEEVQINGVAQTITDKVVNLPAYPTTLPASDVSAWAKAASKPSYAYSEITGKPTIPTKVSDLTNDSGFLTAGIFSFDSQTGTLIITTN